MSDAAPSALPPDTITLALLAGGKSTRFGGVDKGLVRWGARPLVEHILHIFQPYVGSVIINANRNIETYTAIHPRVVTDVFPNFPGPLAGIHAAVQACRTPWLFVLACDMPLVQVEILNRLSQATQLHPAASYIAQSPCGYHPTCALIRNTAEVLPSLVFFLENQRYKLIDWYEHIGTFPVPFESDLIFTNTNTHEEFITINRTLFP